VFKNDAAVAAVLGDGYGAGIQASDAVSALIQLHMGMAGEEDAAGLQGR